MSTILDSFNKDKAKCFNCKKYFELSEIYPASLPSSVDKDLCGNCIITHLTDQKVALPPDTELNLKWVSKNFMSRKSMNFLFRQKKEKNEKT